MAHTDKGSSAKGTPIVSDMEDLAAHLRGKTVTRSTHVGQILVDMGYMTEEQLHQTLMQQRQHPGRRIGELVVEEGHVTPTQLAQALAKRFQTPFVDLQGFDIDPQALGLLPGDKARDLGVLPLGFLGDRLVVAFPDPTDLDALNTVSFVSGYPVVPVVIPAVTIARLQEAYYTQAETEAAYTDAETRAESLLRAEGTSVSLEAPEPSAGESSLEQLERQANELPIVRLVKSIILNAIIQEASDIQIRPETEKVRIYYRIDGQLYLQEELPKHLLRRVVSRIKILGQMNIAERRLPQDGHASMLRGGYPIDLRISVIPMVDGESVVIRILDKEVGVKPVEGLGLTAAELTKVRDAISHAQGMFLVTGPTGSGKSTTLYAFLQEIRDRNPHIITVEDPVEYALEGVEQIQVAPKRGYGFAEALRHILRHDPDVIMVGEIRDRETAEIAMKAALTGHLVLATLHTNDAASTIMRLRDIGIPPYLISTTVLGVMAQRLVRRNCPSCLVPVAEVPEEVQRELGTEAGETFYRGTGCPACGGRGYRGRILVPEILKMDPSLRDAVNHDVDYHRLRTMAREGGMHTLTENGLELARQGLTTLEEVYAIRLA